MSPNLSCIAALCAAAALAAGSAATAAAAEPPPSEQSVQELATLLDARHMLDAVREQLDPVLQKTLEEASQGVAMTPERQAILERMKQRMIEAQTETFKWETFGPMITRVYRDTFSQKEVDQMIAFYKSPGGQAVVKKMPLAMQNIMIQMQPLMKPMFDRIRVIQEETMQELQAADSAAKPAPAAKH